MLEDQLVQSTDFDDDGELVEVLDARLELATVHQMDGDAESITTRVVEKDILDRRLRRRRGSGFSDLGHQVPSPQCVCHVPPMWRRRDRAWPAVRQDRRTR